MEKLDFWSSVGKCFELYFKHFGKFFLPFLWPVLWIFGAAAVVGIIAGFASAMQNAGTIVSIALVILFAISCILFFIVSILAVIRLIIVDCATSIVTKKLLLNNEVPDYPAAMQEVRNDGWKLAKITLACLLYFVLVLIVLAIFSRIIAYLTLNSILYDANFTKIMPFILAILGTFAAVFPIFVYQSFALKKDLCALDCISESIKIVGAHFAPIISIFLAWNIFQQAISLAPVFSFIITVVMFIFVAVPSILKTYWYLRFTEENEEEKGE